MYVHINKNVLALSFAALLQNYTVAMLELAAASPGCAGRPGDGSAALQMQSLLPAPYFR